MNTDTVANQNLPETPFVEVPDPATVTPQPGVLVHAITHLLEQANIEDAQNWTVGLNQEALTSTDIHVQRFWINRHWVHAFTSLPTEEQVAETLNARGCLQGIQCSLEDYMRLFETQVIPCAIKMNILTVKPTA